MELACAEVGVEVDARCSEAPDRWCAPPHAARTAEPPSVLVACPEFVPPETVPVYMPVAVPEVLRHTLPP